MASVAAAPTPPRKRDRFPVHRAGDRDFFLAYVALIWLAVLAGFVPDTVRHIRHDSLAYPLAVHVHAVITVGWLAFLTSQTLLIRKREVQLHRRMGTAGGILAALVVIVGLWAAVSSLSIAFGTPKSRPQFLAISASNIIEFGLLASAAIIARRRPSAHKRLILLATLALTPAAFNRAIGVPFLHPLLGPGVLQTFIQIFAATDIMVAGVGLYDWLTRRRLHPAWVAGASLIVAVQLGASWLMYDPAWKAFATSVVRAW
jgi:uncharacterized membrane protein YozB (DUF420 family)